MLINNARCVKLKEEISNKKSIFRQRQLELAFLKNHLKASMNIIDYAHICSIFLISSDRVLTKQKDIQDCKIIGLIKGKGIDTKRSFLIFYLMWFQIMTSHYSQRVLIFCFLTRRLKFWNTLVLWSYFTVKLVILAKKAVIKNLSKISWKKWACLPIRWKHNVLEETLNKNELDSLKNLSKNPFIIIQKSDKGNFVVILDKKVYLEKMNKMLDKNKQFLKLSKQEDKHYNFFTNLEKKFMNLLKNYINLTSFIRKHMINLALLVHTLAFCMVWLKCTNSLLTTVHH